jgi:hypothetical protein
MVHQSSYCVLMAREMANKLKSHTRENKYQVYLCHVHVFRITSQLVTLMFIPKATLRLGPLHYFRVATLLGSQSVRKVVSVAVQFYVKRWPLSSVCMFVQNIISLSCTIQNFLEGREGVPKEPSSPVFTS